jgi:hypothetical protein
MQHSRAHDQRAEFFKIAIVEHRLGANQLTPIRSFLIDFGNACRQNRQPVKNFFLALTSARNGRTRKKISAAV